MAVMMSFEDINSIEQAEQMRRDFVANVSHELRTPLTALLGFIETLQGPAKSDPTAQDRFLSIMQSEATRMERLVKDLLSLSRVEGEERIRPKEQLDVIGLLNSVLDALGPTAKAAGVTFASSIPVAECLVLGDEDQLRQVFTNLIENAIKYGAKQGTVQLTVTTSDHDPSLRGAGVRIDIKDDGDGIDPVHIPRLTERFYRVDTHRSRELGGTGLGLAIVKHIINRHRGRLRIESKPGEGSCFSVILQISKD
jgi:two-component system phosphate regulon sensor histidine kinase PhoR